MKHLTHLILLFALTASGQSLNIKAGTNYSSYARGGGGGYKFASYFGASATFGHIVLDAKVTTKGSKAPGRYWIYETHQLNTTYMQLSAGYQFRPTFHLSISVAPYAGYMLRAKSTKWNYSPYTWTINYIRRLEWGGEAWVIYHFRDIDGAENIFSLQAGYSYQGNTMARKGFEMAGLRNSVASFGVGFKLF